MEARMRNITNHNDDSKTFQAREGTNKDYILEYVTGSQRNVLYNLANAILAIENDDELMDAFHFNLTTNREMLKTKTGMIPVTDKIAHECREYLQKHCGLRAIKKNDVEDAIHTVSRYHTYDPLMDHLNSLIWDGAPRIDEWLTDCMGAENNEYTRMVGSKMLIAMVNRAIKPGCKCDYMPVFEGPQGIGKSTAVRILGGNYYSENLPPLDANGGKEACIHVLGYWLIEVPEMNVMTATRVESSHLKSFITRTHERFRGINARREQETPRRCFFIGTTNKEQYLRDETGARRFWPVRCTTVNLPWLTTNRDQLLAEALQRCRDGEPIYPDQAFEVAYVVTEQAKRQEFDELFNLVSDWLNSALPGQGGAVTATKIWRGITNKLDAIPTQFEVKRIGAVLTTIGYRQEGREGGRGARVWVK